MELGLTVALTPEEVRELLDADAVLVAKGISTHSWTGPEHDLTVTALAARLGRPVSTIRAWVKAGRFGPTVYKLSERDWRVPVAAVDAFVKARQPVGPGLESTLEPSSPVKRRRRRGGEGEAVDLSAWRRPS